MGKKSFKLISLGVSGGPFEENASGYLLAPFESDQFIALDVGSLLNGIKKAFDLNYFADISLFDEHLTPLGAFFQRHLKAYLISHPHLDHVLGLVLNSQVDTPKDIYGVDATIDALRDHLFNHEIWPNCANEGKDPIGLYQYKRLKFDQKVPITGTEMSVTAFELRHPTPYVSSAFLIEHKESSILYFGDTASDCNEAEKHLQPIWEKVAPLIREKRLKALMLECSYPAGEGHRSFGHLNSSLFVKELQKLKACAGSLEGLEVFVIHQKSSLEKGEPKPWLIEEELRRGYDLGCTLIFPKAGELYTI